MHLSRADRNAAAALLGSPGRSDPPGDEDAEGSLSPVAESNVEGLPNSQLSDFADALEEVGVSVRTYAIDAPLLDGVKGRSHRSTTTST